MVLHVCTDAQHGTTHLIVPHVCTHAQHGATRIGVFWAPDAPVRLLGIGTPPPLPTHSLCTPYAISGTDLAYCPTLSWYAFLVRASTLKLGAIIEHRGISS
eukprot:3858633-Rhodomonas_salina.1